MFSVLCGFCCSFVCLVGLVYLCFFRIIPLLIASAKLNLCFQGFLRAVKLFSWNYGPETGVGSGQWDLGSLLLWD